MGEDAKTVALIEANGLRPDALEANRAGHLTPDQAQVLRRHRSFLGLVLVLIAMTCIAVGAWDFIPGHEESPGDGRFGDIALLVVGALLLRARSSDQFRSYATELATGRVSSIDGVIRVHHTSSSGDSGTTDSYYYMIGDRRFDTTEEGARLIDALSRYRIYHVPDSDMMVNIEPIGSQSGEHLSVEEIAAIVGESMRPTMVAEHPNLQKIAEKIAGCKFPAFVVCAFESVSGDCRVIFKFNLEGQDSWFSNFYRRVLANAPGARAVAGLGDEALFCDGGLLVRRGEIFITVTLECPRASRDSEHLLEIERRLATLALRSMRTPEQLREAIASRENSY